jgi:predicted membrane-bound spermidine synthase
VPPAVLFFLSGLAALSWELLWQIHAALAIGSTAASVALTISVTMGGMSVGAVAAGALLARHPVFARRPFVALAAVEGVIGLLGLGLPFSVACAIPAAIAMGATVPLMKLVGGDVAVLYGVNAAGAFIGIFAQTFAVIPAFGLRGAGGVAAVVNLVVALGALRRGAAPVQARAAAPSRRGDVGASAAALVAFVTGFVTFALEVTWFRSLKAAFQSTTDSFALMLAAVIVAIVAGSAIARRLQPRRRTLALVVLVGAALIVAASPLIDRIDLFDVGATSYWSLLGKRVAITLVLVGLPVTAVACILPALFEATDDARLVGRLYGVNTAGCLAGALATTWLLLPHLGSYRAALLSAALLAAVGVALADGRWRLVAALSFAACLAGGLRVDSGVARVRVQAAQLSRELHPLASIEGSDATVSVAVDGAGNRQLIIDGFQTSGEAPEGHYMQWMGRLPMLFHPHPTHALVICFGTGQTANAVRREGPAVEDIVELSPAVIALARWFPSNEDVLADPRAHVHVTDGRSWLRRSAERYDVVTLEPMEPHFAGTNDLYSLEFYRAAAAHLDDDGVLAQWLPLHLLLPEESASVVRTFVEVFPNAALWIDPRDRTGILIGKKGGGPMVESLNRAAVAFGSRDLDAAAIRAAFALDGERLRRYGSAGALITDDSQLLAYGRERHRLWRIGGNAGNHDLNLRIIRAIAASQ